MPASRHCPGTCHKVSSAPKLHWCDKFMSLIFSKEWQSCLVSKSKPTISYLAVNLFLCVISPIILLCACVRVCVCVCVGAYLGGPCACPPPPFESEKIDLCRCHEHHNGSYRPSWSKTCSRMHQNAPFRRRKCQNFSGEGPQPPL